MGALMEGPVRSQPRDMPIITEAVAVRDGTLSQPVESIEKRLAGEAEASRNFWARTLQTSTTPSFPEVPAGHRPQATRRVRKGLRVRFSVDSAHQARTAWVHGAWALTLSQYQGSDVIFGAGISAYDRDLAIVPQRVTMDSLDASISDFFQCVGTHMEAMAYHSRYHGIQEIQTIDEHCAAACAFQSLVIVNSQSDQNKNKIQTSNHDVHDYALVLDISSHGQDGSISIEVAFDPVALELIQVERLLAHFEHVLQQTSAMGSDRILRDIDHVPSSHWDELKTWNGNVPEPLERTVHSLFESRADLQPDEPAICARDGEWTYAELDKVAEHFARLLRSLGVKQGSYVPLVFEKCGLAIVAMLAVLKAGGASVALDPAQPPQRLASLVAGMGECIVISSAENRDLASGFGRRNVVLDANTVRALSARSSQPRLSTETLTVSPDTTAFVLFTSGSTGTPKGILIPHKAFASSIRGHGEVLRFSTGPGSRNFQYTAYTSDVSIGEIFTSLALGSCVCVPSDWDRKNNIAGSMRDFGVNWAFFTPSVATLLGPSEVPSLRTLVFGGETASPENFATWAPSLYLINSFGPAECSIWTHCIPRPVELSDFGSNIGYGVSCATWITDPDDYNRLLPIGAIGELLTDGPNVAAGYLNAPEKSQATFVADPIWKPANRKSMRLYRSGDLARFLPNGMVQFLGRRDHQVKLNGLRVELGEIEHQIRRLVPDEMMVAVDVVNPHPVGSSRILAAFIAPKKPISTTANNTSAKPEASSDTQNLLSLLQHEVPAPLQSALDGLEDSLKNVLPRHMVPAAYVPLGEMPLTASAKTDRKVLKMLASMVPTEELVRLGTRSSSRQLNAPGTVMEKLLARLWAAALGRELDLDVGDSFFKVGGDSLSAMRLVSMAGSHNLKLSVEQVFKSATLGEMAQVVVMGDESASKDQEGTTAAVAAPFAMVGGAAATATGAIGSAAEYFGVEVDEVEDIYPCTPLQEGLLALSQDGRGTYVAQMVHKLSSDIDQTRFKEAWSTVLEDWPILRTKFFPLAREDGTIRLMQAVLRSKPRWKKARSLEEYLKLDARDRMQTGDDMLRMALFKDRKTNEDYFVMTIHHAVFDGWMLALLLTSFRRAYAGISRPELTPFNVFIQCLEGRGREKSREYWQRYVDGLPRLSWPELPAPDFRPRSNAVQTRTARLPETRGAQSFTPTTWLRTAFAIILGAYSCTDDVVFASTVYGRASHLLASADTVAGPTLATIPIRVRIPRETRVEDVLAMVQAESAEMLAYEQEGLQTIKQYNSEALATVDAQSLLVVQVDEPHASAPQNVDVEAAGAFQFKIEPPKGLDNGYHNCALVLEATVSEKDLHLVATHDDNVLKPDEVQRFLRQMTHVVGQLCGNEGSKELRIADLDLAAPEDVAEMREWNGVVAEPMRALIHELFKERAQEQPDAEALVSHEGSLTFKELDELSTRLAGHLWTAHGLRPGMHVPLVFEKSLWAVVAMMAVLKVGAANVALNPAQPADVLQSLVSDVDAEFVLCSEKSLSLVQEHFPRYMCVGPSMEANGALSGDNEASVTPDHLAFLLFTSGSTGKPKAIMIDHTAFCSSMRGHGETLCYNKGGRNLQFTAYTSDVSIGEIFTSLTRGATVCIPSDEERMNMNDLAAAMERMRVDWAFLTPSVASLLDPNKVPSLKTLLYGGETATVTNINTWAPRLHLINSFGPAETSIWSHAHPHFTTADIGSDIGWSLGCATWIVDPEDCHRLMPIGAIGELVVEGPNVAAGYYNNPEKTKHAFVGKLSFLGDEKKNRIYRMGDLARWMPGGRVQFLGRKDTQVKLHGLKVDVGGVEDKIRVALGGLGQVGLEVAVEMIENPADRSDSRLVAFVSAESFGQSQDRRAVAVVEDEEALQSFVERTEGLRAKLSAVLPAFTIPSFFVALTSMPLNASAKTDRKRLRSLVASLGFAGLSRFSLATRREVQVPQTQMEKRLHNLWSTVMNLGLEDFGVEADFFECGGDSIMAIKLASLARTIKVSLSVQDIYQSPRLADLAALIEGRTPNLQGDSPEDIPAFSLLPKSVAGSSVDSLKARIAEGCGVDLDEVIDAYPVTPTQHDLFYYGLKQPGALWMQNVFRIPDNVDVDRLGRAWRSLVLNNDMLRTRVVSSEDELLQVVLRSPGELTHTECPPAELEAFLASEQLRTLVSGQSLSHVTVVNKEWLVVTLHHILYDAWSLNKLFAFLDVEYSRVSNETDEVVAKQEQRVDFRHFMKVILDEDNKAAASAFWHNELLGVSTRPFAEETAQGRSSNVFVRHSIKLPQSVGGVRAYRTPAELGYAALGLAFHEQLQTADTIVRMVSTGRAIAAVPGIEDLLGPTVNNVPVRLRHSEGATSTSFIAHVRDQLQSLAPWEQASFKEVAQLHPDAQAACDVAPLVIVQAIDPYAEPPAGGIGLERRPQPIFWDNGMPFIVALSPILRGKDLESIDAIVYFADAVVAEKKVKRLVAVLDFVVRAITTANEEIDVSELLKIKDEDLEKVQGEMMVIRAGDQQ